ncbi:sulfotransferase domain-containing protein [Subsaxibacter sp. CAU 1640]|uniref:sulfotransferase domain-containing protein n=1 Tax=Subsaxibacter sp. CAU 1640 TaxID=2933271 RepID=UPI002006B9AC|nr:sulfotransferase domain-containing protein [Subsaxibacter sp. CAU 1640]MCK7589906.1 sulfotransferase domain-containing protein [Subsaxibacter sp. CAU 1640]
MKYFFKKYIDYNEKRKYEHVLIACLPKSGSTFLSDVLVNVTGFDFVQFQPIRGTNDHNIDHHFFYENSNKNTVTQLHIKPNDSNKKIFLKENIKIVFLYRDLLSSLKSMHRHILEENNKWFMFSIADGFESWSIERQFDFIIDLIAPWYINFLTAWKKEISLGELSVLEVNYDDFRKDNDKTIHNILNFYGLNYSKERIKDSLEISYSKKDKLRFNNKENKIDYKFSDEQIGKIKSLVSYYPEYAINI